MSYLAGDHDLAPESVRFAAALCASAIPHPGADVDERQLARFALGLCDADEQTVVLRALIRSGPMRERLLALRSECRMGSAASRSSAAALALREAAAKASAVFGTVERWIEGRDAAEDGLFRRALATVARTIQAGQFQQVAAARGESADFRTSALAIDLEDDDLVAFARFEGGPGEFEGIHFTLALADPAGGVVALVAEPVRNGIWEARVEGFGSASGLRGDDLTPDLFCLIGPQTDAVGETVSRLPVTVRDGMDNAISEEADIRAHGPIRFQDEGIVVTLSASSDTRERFSKGVLALSLPLGTLDLPLGAWAIAEWTDAPRTLTIPLPGAQDGTLVCGSFLLAEIVPNI
ncbi:hypothetical protein EON79_02915 [bacterium]|nr:MAG: hypothetical protein EON79_02915 [bacterium]